MRLAPLSFFLLLGACAPTDAPVVAAPPPPPSAPAIVEVVPRAGFRAIDVPPTSERAIFSAQTPEGVIRIDALGGRWVIPEGGDGTHAEGLDVPHLAIGWSDGIGLVAIDEDQRFRVAKTALAPWDEGTKLPDAATNPRLFHGGISAHERGGVVVFENAGFHPVAPLGDRVAVDAFVGADGIGLGLFEGGGLGGTRDHGAHWSAIPTVGIDATRLAVVNDRLLVEDGGVRDGFARALDEKSGLLVRAAPDLQHISAADRGDRPMFPRGFRPPVKIVDGAPVRLEATRYLADHRAVLDGDDLVAVERSADGSFHFGRARLGEPFRFEPARNLDDVCRKEVNVRVSGCHGTVVASCGSAIVYRDEAGHELTAKPNEGERWLDVALASKDVLRVVASDEHHKLTTFAMAPTGVVLDLVKELDPHAFFGQFYGRCAAVATEAPMWLKTNASLYAIAPDGLHEVGADDRRRAAYGLIDGAHLALSAKAKEMVVVDAKGVVETRAIDEPIGEVAIAEDGLHGLAISHGSIFRTDDGGRTFARLDRPKALAKAEKAFCGRTRCIVDDLALYDGWGDPYVLPAEGDDAEAPTDKLVRASQTFTCAIDEARDGALVALGTIDDLSAGISPILAVGTRIVESKKRYEGVFVDENGGVATRALGAADRENPGAVQTIATLGAGLVHSDYRAHTERGAFGFSATGPMIPLAFTSTGARGSFVRTAGLFDDGRVGVFADRDGRFLTLSTSGKHEERDLPRSDGSRSIDTRDSYVELADRTLVALFDGRRSASVVAVGLAEDAVSRGLVLASEDATERGAAVLHDGANAFIANVETTANGGTTLRLRPLDPKTLEVGDARPPIVSADPGKWLSFAPCAAGAKGARLQLETNANVGFHVGDLVLEAHLVRTIVVTETTACLDRSGFDTRLASSAVWLFKGTPRRTTDVPFFSIMPNGNGVAVIDRKARAVKCDGP